MGFNLSGLYRYKPGQGQSDPDEFSWSWLYETSDNLSTIGAANYFVGALKSLRQGDLMLVTAGDGYAIGVVVDAYHGADSSGDVVSVNVLPTSVWDHTSLGLRNDF